MEAYEKKDFNKCLYLALKYINSGADLNAIPNNVAILKVIRFSADTLVDKIQGGSRHIKSDLKNEACSFCFKSGNDVQLFNGVNVRICHECIKIMHGLMDQ
jgi:hypothetical protein